MRVLRTALVGIFGSLLLCNTAFSQDLLPADNGLATYHRAPRYRPSESHPLRVVGYVLHPIGWLFREGLFRPWSSFAGSTEFNKSFWGFREPFDFRSGYCFDDTGIPDCRSLPPYTNLYKEKEGPATMVAVPQKHVFFPDVAFEFDKSKLTDLGRGRVRQIAQILTTEPELDVVLEGHTDFIGTDGYNQALGERRAQSVLNELIELGVDPARLATLTKGEAEPIFTEQEDWARAVNRSVRLRIKAAAATQ